MKILYTGFKGKNNASKKLLDTLDGDSKLYLTNSFTKSVNELLSELQKKHYDTIFCFGQAPLSPIEIRIELVGKNKDNYIDDYLTNYNYSNLKNELIENRYHVVISKDAGKYLCNNLYYHALKYIIDNNLKTEILFIHIPNSFNECDFAKIKQVLDKILMK